MTEEAKPRTRKRKPLKSSDTKMVTNTSNKTLNLANGSIKSGAKGKATIAEISMLHAYLEV